MCACSVYVGSFVVCFVSRCYVRGSKSNGTGILHEAKALDALLRVVSEMRMYLRKQSLDQRPILCIRYFGHPIAAAVDAAPMRRECEDTFAAPLVVLFRRALISDLVRKDPFLKMKRGPRGLGWEAI